MNKAFFTRCNFNKYAEGHKAGYLAGEECADLGGLSNGVYNLERFFTVFGIDSSDKYTSVFLNVYLAFAFGADFLNNLAA